VLFFLITYHHPLLSIRSSYKIIPSLLTTITLLYVCFYGTSVTSLITRTDIPRSRINISLAAILEPVFCSRSSCAINSSEVTAHYKLNCIATMASYINHHKTTRHIAHKFQTNMTTRSEITLHNGCHTTDHLRTTLGIGHTWHTSKRHYIRSPTIAARCHYVPNDARDPICERWNYVGEN
jgi:hypothetical protein